MLGREERAGVCHRARRLPGVPLLRRPDVEWWSTRVSPAFWADFWHDALAVLASIDAFCGYTRHNVAIVRDL